MRIRILFKESCFKSRNDAVCSITYPIYGNSLWHKGVQVSNCGDAHLLRISLDKEPTVPT